MTKIPETNFDFNGIKIACIGDSLTYGTTLIKRKRDCYPSRLQRVLGEKFDVVNLGFPGHTVNPYCEKYWGDLQVIDFVEKYQPDYIIFMLGTNDARLHNWTDSKTFEKEYNRLLSYFQNLQSKPTIIVLTSPHTYNTNKLVDLDTDLLEQIVNIQKDIASQHNLTLIDLYAMTEGREDLYSPDYVHLNSKGAKLVSFNVYYKIIDDIRQKNRKYKDRINATSIKCKK